MKPPPEPEPESRPKPHGQQQQQQPAPLTLRPTTSRPSWHKQSTSFGLSFIIISIIFNYLILNCVLAASASQICVISVESKTGEYQETCEFWPEEATNQINIDCSQLSETPSNTSSADLVTCKQLVDRYFMGKPRGAPVCKMQITLRYLAPHGILFDLNTIVGKCQNNCFETQLKFDKFIHVPSRAIPLNIFPHVSQNTMELKQLTISGGSIMPLGLLERGGIDTANIKQILKWSEAGEIVMEKITSDEAIVEGQYLIENKVKRKTESFLLDGTSYAGIRRYGIDLTNVNRFGLKNINFGNKPIESKAIVIRWNEQECPESEVKYYISDLSGLGTINPGPISFENKCKPVSSQSNGNRTKLHLKFIIIDNKFWPNIPKNTFGQLLEDIDTYRNNTKLTFAFEQIDCCLEDNKWLFELRDRQNETDYEYVAACHDIGKFVSNYSLWSLKDTCENRNVAPIYMIAVAAVVLLGLLLVTFSCICCFYVLPKRHGAAIHMKSDIGLEDAGGSTTSKSASTDRTGAVKRSNANDSPTGVVTIHSNQSRVPRASMPGDSQATVSPEVRSANTFTRSPLAMLRSLFTSQGSKPVAPTHYKQVKYSSVIPKKVFVESKSSKQEGAGKQAHKAGSPMSVAKKGSKISPKTSGGAGGSKSKATKKVADNKHGIKSVKSHNSSVRTMQTVLTPPASKAPNPPAKTIGTIKTLGLSKVASKGAGSPGTSQSQTGDSDAKSERMSSVFQTIS